jgi:hypothetical protein
MSDLFIPLPPMSLFVIPPNHALLCRTLFLFAYLSALVVEGVDGNPYCLCQDLNASQTFHSASTSRQTYRQKKRKKDS